MFCSKFKRTIALSFVFMFLIFSFATGVEVSALSEDEISAPSAVLMEPVTKKVLFGKNPHDSRACASITKVMTLILVFEAIEDDRIDYDDIVTTSAHASSMGGSDIWLEPGETMTVHEMIKAVVVASANDAAVALAELVCGTEDEFVNRMNVRAKELGMNNTVFKNCNGLDEEGHLTTAYDVALMSAELIRHEKIFEYSSIWLDYLRDGETQIVNTNKLLKSYSGITGLKTGTTGQAGSCMSATAQRDGLSLVAVVLGCDTGSARFSDAAKLLDFGFANYKMEKIVLPDNLPASLKVTNGMESSVDIVCCTKSSVLLPKGNSKGLSAEFTVAEELKAPIIEGQIVGKLTYTCNDEVVDEYDILAKTSVEPLTFGSIWRLLWEKLFSL